MTWCILVLGDWEKEEGRPLASCCCTCRRHPAGLMDGEPTKGSSNVTVFVGLKTSCRIKKLERSGPLLFSARIGTALVPE